MTEVSATNFVFNARADSSSVNIIRTVFNSKDVTVGDAFTITNRGKGIEIHLNPQGFSNLHTSGLSDKYVLRPRGVNTALILITAGDNPREKNVNIVYSVGTPTPG
jgi:hypothetical protein